MLWNEYVRHEDLRTMEATGYGCQLTLGSRPALLVVDFTYAFCGREPLPIEEAIRRWPNACGEPAWEALAKARLLIEEARDQNVPVIYTKGRDAASSAGPGRWADKNQRLSGQDATLHEIAETISPVAGDTVLVKGKPSAFHATSLCETLIERGIDTLLVCGATTSGCVRATVVDAFSWNYRVAIVHDASVDRSQTSHWVSLYDMHMKYGNVVDQVEASEYLRALT